MSNLPVIVGYGGINAAGRSSSHQMYKRLVLDALDEEQALQTYAELAVMMKLVSYQDGVYISESGERLTRQEIKQVFGSTIRDNTLIRAIASELFDTDAVDFNREATLAPDINDAVAFMMKKEQLPEPLPSGWQVSDRENGLVFVRVTDNLDIKVSRPREQKVKAAAQMPSGFDPGESYAARNHPRGVQMSVYAASDAIQSTGIPWEKVLNHVAPDQISVYAGSLMGQMDEDGLGGLVKSWLTGKNARSTQLSLGLTSMCTDFISSYVLSNLGSIGSHQGACASFLYNLEHAVQDIAQGKSRVAVVGSSEAPITPEVIEGFNAMGALANADKIMALDKLSSSSEIDHSRNSRPFAKNCGFTIAESAQYVVLFDDKLVLELGANILGSVPSVFINADGNKKSITAPGAGNYLTLAKAVASARNIIGEQALRRRTFVQAHGSSTPLNRITESHVLDSVAQAFDIRDWPVTAVKSYVGHSLASASGDQLAATLGVWEYGLIPGIPTLERVADDVHNERLALFREHKNVGCDAMDAAFINSKGFGGNNATAVVLSPQFTRSMLEKRHGSLSMLNYDKANGAVRENVSLYNRQVASGTNKSVYKFGESVVDGSDIEISDTGIRINGYHQAIAYPGETKYRDML
ncbi:beta-ketoacyl synthase [Thalassomonas viridans]|uniref:Beta-ketoacyl synthase n=1 Tax=Thalassomonas viridans TaxID=137584 RepID=A0AAF0CA28_9GAMM|nr:beta-ketoacyl synthase [Thalassomonas viridans]WDE06076.1 beta-ketoacyl synthase [Thalassomonas viridans]